MKRLNSGIFNRLRGTGHSTLPGTPALFLAGVLCFTAACKKEPEKVMQIETSSKKNAGASVSAVGDNIWYDKFVAYDNAYGDNSYTSTSTATLAWGESYMLRSYVKMWELTKNTAWLDKLTTHVDVIIANATDLGGDGYLDWGTTKYGDGGKYPYLVHDGMIALPIAQFVRLVHQYPTTLSAYATKAAAYRTFIETHVVPKWEDPNSYMGNCWVLYSSSTGYYKQPAFNAFPGQNYTQLPYNMMGPYAEMLWTMYDVNGNSFYNTRANQMAQNFKNALVTNGSAYKWKYAFVLPQIEDTSHGNLDVGMARESFNRAGTISGTHIAKISYAFTGIMWNQSVSAPLVKDNVDGTGTSYVYTKYIGDWIPMTQFNQNAWLIGAGQYRNFTIPSMDHNYAYNLVQLMAWDLEKVINQGFEYVAYHDATLPAQWVRGAGTTSEVRRYTADKKNGKASAAITSTTGDDLWQMLYQDWKQWKANTTYEVSFDVKTSGSNGARIFIQNVTAGTILGTVHDYPSSPSWTSQSFTVTTPSTTSPHLRLYLENNFKSTAGTALFDNVKIKRVGSAW